MINRLGFNNEGHDALPTSALPRARDAAASSASTSAPTRTAPTASATMSSASRRFAQCRQLSHRQHLLAQHAGPAQHAGARAAWPSFCRASWRRARAAAGARCRCSSRSRRIWPRPSWTTSPPRCLPKAIDGVIVSNTTLARPDLRSSARRGEAGGLSGKPLFERSTIVLAQMRKLLGPESRHHRRRRRRFGRDGAGKDPRRRRSRAALHRHDLCRARAAGPHRRRAWHDFAETRAARRASRELRDSAARSLGATSLLS